MTGCPLLRQVSDTAIHRHAFIWLLQLILYLAKSLDEEFFSIHDSYK